MQGWFKVILFWGVLLSGVLPGSGADLLTVCTYNVENYLDAPVSGRKVKPDEERAAIRANLLAIEADVVAFQEMGRESALLELRSSLAKEGLEYPYWVHTKGWDTNIFLAVLSRYPIVREHRHENLSYLVGGRRLHMSRGLCDLEIEVEGRYRFTLLNCHLKSRRPIGIADEADMRLEEARIVRKIVEDRLARSGQENLMVLGDFNDLKSARPVREVKGSGKGGLIDLRPAERNGDSIPASNPRYDPPHVTWTYFYGRDDSYQRIDYIMVSKEMAREINPSGCYVYAVANWALASDHRPVVAQFHIGDR